MSQLAVFLDRDGVINDFKCPVNHPRDLILYPWTAPAIRRLNEAGYRVFVVTNQGGVETGHVTAAEVEAIHSRLQDLLVGQGAFIDEIVYCPHFRSGCACRKPQPGMILKLAEKYHVDLKKSWLIGDRKMDIQAGAAAGCRTIKLGAALPLADYTCHNLGEAVEQVILKTPVLVQA